MDGKNVIAVVKSMSNPAKTYEICKGKDGRVYCSCPAWKFGGTGTCKHLKALKAELPAIPG